MAQLSAVVNMWWTVRRLALTRRQMASPIENHLQQATSARATRSLPQTCRLAQCHTA